MISAALKRSGGSPYSSAAWASQPAVRAVAKMALASSGGMRARRRALFQASDQSVTTPDETPRLVPLARWRARSAGALVPYLCAEGEERPLYDGGLGCVFRCHVLPIGSTGCHRMGCSPMTQSVLLLAMRTLSLVGRSLLLLIMGVVPFRDPAAVQVFDGA